MSEIRRSLIAEVGGGNIPKDALPIGGRIYYIYNDNGATYRFFEETGKEITDISVSGLANAYWYTVENAPAYSVPTKDKFYVYDITGVFSGTYGTYGYQTGAQYNTVGYGKPNTVNILTNYSSTMGTIWTALVEKRTSFVGGCNDWFIGCSNELLPLKNSGLVDWFNSYRIWTSQQTGANEAYMWNYWNGMWQSQTKQAGFNCFAIRSF